MKIYGVYVLLTLILPIVALLYHGLERKFAARLQGRVGPPITQSWLDFIKLMTKKVRLPEDTNVMMLVSGLLLMFAGALIPLVMVFLRRGDLILLMYLMVGGTIGILLVGLSFRSPYSRIGVSREMQMAFSYELAFIFSIILYIGITGWRTLEDMTGTLPPVVRYPLLVIPLILMLFVIPAKVGVVPVDIGEAESEIAEGPFVEIGGGHLAVVKVASAMKMLALLQLVTLMFFLPPSVGGVWFWVLSLVIDAVLMFFTISVVRNAASRIKIDQAVKLYASVPILIGAFGLLVLYLLRG